MMILRTNCRVKSFVLVLLVTSISVTAPDGFTRGDEIEENSTETVPWRKKLDAWRAKLDLRKEWTAEMKQVMADIGAIDDPAAVSPITALLAREKDRAMKIVYLQALGSIGRSTRLQPDTPEAKSLLKTLVKYSVEEEAARNTDPLRDEASKQISQLPNRQGAIPIYIRYLSGKYVSRAAEALSATNLASKAQTFDMPEAKLTKALIDALVQKRVRKVPVYEWREASGAMGNAITGRRTWYRWERGVRMVSVTDYVPNAAVYKTLVQYTGADYQYDRSKWRSWYDSNVYTRQ